MTFHLFINCDYDAFAEAPRSEIARLLRDAAEKVENGLDWVSLIDSNGNTAGECEIAHEA